MEVMEQWSTAAVVFYLLRLKHKLLPMVYVVVKYVQDVKRKTKKCYDDH